MFYHTFLSPQVKQCGIITYKHGIYELPHELPNDLRLRILGNIRRVPKFIERDKRDRDKICLTL